MMTQNQLVGNKDVLAAVKRHVPITPCEEKALVQFVSSRTSTTYGKVQKDLASLGIPDCLNVVGTSLDNGDKHSCFFDGFDDDKECDQVLIFHRMGCGKEPPPPSKYLPMGHIGRCQTRLRHLHRTHGHGGVSFRIFYMMLPNEKEATFVRAFDVIKRFTNSFTETSVAHVGCQPATIIALG